MQDQSQETVLTQVLHNKVKQIWSFESQTHNFLK